MKKLFNIEIKETISDIFEIEAESSEEAEYLAEKGYYNGVYILDGLNEQKREFNCSDINSPRYMSNQRKEQILTELFDYVLEHCEDEKNYYRALKNNIQLSEDEITLLGIDVKRELIEITPLQDSEIKFENELLNKDDEISAYIPLSNIDPFEKFALEKKEGFEYNMYLHYYKYGNKSIITIKEQDDSDNVIYEYETSIVEHEMIRNKLDEYCKSQYNQSINEFMNDKKRRVNMKNKLTLISLVCIGGDNDTMMYDTVIEYQGKKWNIEVDKSWDDRKGKYLWKIETDLKLNYDTKKAIIENISKDMPSICSDIEPKKYNTVIISENKEKTLKGWYESYKKDLTDYLHIGDKVDRNLIDNLIDSLPPITLNGEIVQIGGAYSSDNEGRATYITFATEKPFGDWYYKGACIKGETINREYEFEEFELDDEINEIEESR